VLGVIHYLWLVKQDTTQPLIYGAVLAVLLAARLPWGVRLLQAAREAAVPIRSPRRNGDTRAGPMVLRGDCWRERS